MKWWLAWNVLLPFLALLVAPSALATGSETVVQPKWVSLGIERMRQLGMMTETVTRQTSRRSVQAVGMVQVDERKLQVIALKYEAWVEKLLVNATGQAVRKGQPLMEVYSPALVLAQQEYLTAIEAGTGLSGADGETRASVGKLAEGALTRLGHWDVSADQLRRLQSSGKVRRTVRIDSPINGIVLEKGVVQGMRALPGEPLYRLVDLSTVWVVADVFAEDAESVRVGARAEVSLRAIPGKIFTGKVAFIHPILSAETRTLQVRIELANPDLELRPALYATVILAPTEANLLSIPASALWSANGVSRVVVDRGEGVLEPRQVRTGRLDGERLALEDGLMTGEKVVVGVKEWVEKIPELRAVIDPGSP
ncbi:MAG: efflux RND transporter periplasmic adaptor subunit [Magnetococcales bacterium]|nr:efflux RND transporter periplasmic adaptor subunit [Magnetococcales bacterium]